MTQIFDPVEQHKTLSIMPTFQCTAECRHCGTLSSPREKTRLTLDEMISAIDEGAASGYEVVVFTGGEATLVGKDLHAGIARAAGHGLKVRLVSNAYWATSPKAAAMRVQQLVAAGLDEINFSTGDQHARFVPVENVIRATRASVAAGLPVAIMVETLSDRRVTQETVEEHPDFKRIVEEYPAAAIKVHESPWMPLSPTHIERYADGLAANRFNVELRTGCDSILTTTTVEADGKIGACCGLGMRLIPELQLGNIRDTSLAAADRKAADDFLKRWIQVEGPERILAWAARYDPEIEWEDMYAHRCQACIRLYKDSRVRQVIMEHHRDKLADVLFSEWLLYHYSGQAKEPATASVP